MLKTVLHNPAEGANIIDYRISEAVIDEETGEAIIDTGNGQPVSTGRTFEWTIKKGETMRFPKYVADYLLQVFPFLKVVPGNKATQEAEKTTFGLEE